MRRYSRPNPFVDIEAEDSSESEDYTDSACSEEASLHMGNSNGMAQIVSSVVQKRWITLLTMFVFLDCEDFLNDGSDSDENGDGADIILGSERPRLSWNELNQRANAQDVHVPSDMDMLVESILSRAELGRGHEKRRATGSDFLGMDQYDDGLLEQILRGPKSAEDNFPLWRVRCEIGMEEEAVFFLLQSVQQDKHRVRSAFTRGSIRGWIYLESIMDSRLVKLLKQCPGIIKTRQGIIQQGIEDISEWTKLLTMKSPKNGSDSASSSISPGTWVQIRKGKYKGDVGLAIVVEDWGVEVLLVPRLALASLQWLDGPSSEPPQTTRKRKRGPDDIDSRDSSSPNLFDPCSFRATYGREPHRLGDNEYRVGSTVYEHGLIRKKFDYHSLSSAVSDIPLAQHRLFQQSKHPRLDTCIFPPPFEWLFEEADRVLIQTSKRSGFVVSNWDKKDPKTRNMIEVMCDDGELLSVSYLELQKDIKLGDYVEIRRGLLQGSMGWVDAVHDNGLIHIVNLGPPVSSSNHSDQPFQASTSSKSVQPLTQGYNITGTGADNNNALKLITEYDVHANSVKVSMSPFYQEVFASGGIPITTDSNKGKTQTGPQAKLSPRHKHVTREAWYHRHVIISKTKNPWKGHKGIVKNVVTGQQTSSGMKIEIELATFDPSHPFKRVTVDYDDILEVDTMKQLRLSRGHQSSDDGFKSLATSADIVPVESKKDLEVPHATSTLEAAWDPSSRTPVWNPVDSEAGRPSTSMNIESARSESAASTLVPQHPLLDRRLVGCKLRVDIVDDNSSSSKRDVPVSVEEIAGTICIRRELYKKSVPVDPQAVKILNPSATRDNGLLVVIHGEHCGKYVRRVHHRYQDGKATIILAVVNHMEGRADVLLGEQLELEAGELCLAMESKKNKGLSASIMSALREDARKSYDHSNRVNKSRDS
ncbi:hypothetical protein CVT24_000864 [Panaeolus cyanescens]|uniref:NGN domain-containing protein n=1 Tax=Panaeolus cyanescens TaxID=181874 RepID=A0A409W7C7_9AGAR|nr:hypothetical protein CVT24_000864 [Panaeolus cyanescens]